MASPKPRRTAPDAEPLTPGSTLPGDGVGRTRTQGDPDAVQDMSALARLNQQLASARSEDEIIRALQGLLEHLAPRMEAAAVYLVDGDMSGHAPRRVVTLGTVELAPPPEQLQTSDWFERLARSPESALGVIELPTPAGGRSEGAWRLLPLSAGTTKDPAGFIGFVPREPAGDSSWHSSLALGASMTAAALATARERAAMETSMALLQASEQRFHSLADQAPVMMWVTESDGTCSYLNRAWYDFTGQTRRDVPGQTWIDALHPDDVATASGQFLEAHTSGKGYQSEYRVRRHDGAYRWVLDSASPRIGSGGEFLGFVGSVIDISERRESEHSAAARADRLRLALASSNAGDWSWDADTDIVTLSPRAAEIFGIAPGPVITWTAMRGMLDPKDAERARRAIEVSLVSRSDYDVEYRILRPSGGFSWVAVRGRGMYTEDGRVTGMIGVLQEINGRKRAEQALLDREERLNQLVSLMPAGTYACDSRGRITFYNKRAVELWGREPRINSDQDRFVGASAIWLLDGTPLAPSATPMAMAIETGRSVRNYEVIAARPDGTRWVASLNIDPLRDASGLIVGAINVFLDITERKRSENLMAGHNRALELLASGAPLSGILSELASTAGRVRDGTRASILLWDTQSRRLAVGAAPGLPASYGVEAEALGQLGVFGTAGRAISSGQLEVCEDVAADPDWTPARKLVANVGMRSSWSVPIRGGGGLVLGSIDCYLRERRVPSAREREIVETLARAAAIAIERRRAEEAAQLAEAQLRLVTDSAPVMLMQCDEHRRVTFVNRAYLERTGRIFEEVVGRPLQEVFEPEAYERIRAYVDLVLAGVRVDFEHEVEFPRIGARTLSVSFVPDRGPEGSVRGWVSASSDITENKLADAATRQLAAIVESSDDAIISKDLNGRITSWNAGAERLFGYSAAEMMGRFFLDIVPPELADEDHSILSRMRRGEYIAHLETRRLHKDGRSIDVSLTISPIRDAQRRTLGISTIARDITAQKRQEAELLRREQLYRAIGESINYGIWVCDATGKNIYASDSFLKLVGLTQEECSGDGWGRVLHPDERDATFASWNECVRSGRFWEREYTFKGIDGNWHPVLSRGVPIHDENGQITSWVGIHLDISGFKAAQEAIRQGELRFRAMADNIAQIAWMAEGNGRVFWFNQRWIDYTGSNADDVSGYSHLRAVHPDHRARALEKFEQALREERAWEDTFPLRGRDGQYRWFLARAVPIRDEAGLTSRWFGTATDVTDLRHAQDVLRQRSRTLETLNRVGNALVAELNLERIVQTVTEAGRDISGAAFGSFIAKPPPAEGRPIMMDAAPREALERFGLPYNNELFEITFRGERALRIADLHLDPRVPAALAGMSEQRLASAVRSYLAVPVVSRSGEVFGGLFFGHPAPGVFTETAQNILTGLAAQAAIAIDNANLYAALQRELVQQKRADAALRASERQLRLVTDHAPVLLVLCDRECRYKFANRPYANRHGREPAELIGHAMADIVGPEAHEPMRPQIAAVLEGRQQHFELEIPYDVLGNRWMEVVCVPERDPTGEVIGFLAVMTDITGRKQVEREIEIARDRALAASRAKDDFLAALSHELRTPLNPVLLLASEAADDPQLSPEVRGAFATIRNNVELEARLIDDLLDLTRIVRGKLPLQMRAHDAHTILQAALATVRAEIAQKQISLDLDLAAAPADIWGDAVRVQQIFWNVLKNAVKFTPVGGRIGVRTAREPERKRLVIQISDTGIGMTQTELGRIFDAFTQGDHAGSGGSHIFGGVGLGLAISQMLVEQHEGSIRAESAGRDAGSTFTIELPLAAVSPGAAPEKAPARPASEGRAARGARILLVEDHDTTRQTLAQLLSRRQFEVTSAATLAEARAAAEQTSFALVISDIGLPDGNGYDLMRELAARGPVKGIALSGYGMEEDLARSREAGFQQHLTKPVRVQSLDRALAELGPLDVP